MLRRRGRVAAAATAVFHAELVNAAAALLAPGSLGQVALRGSGEEEDVPRRDAADGGRSRRGRRQAAEAVVGDSGVATPATLRRRSVAGVDEVHRRDVSVLRLPALRLGRRRLGVLVGLSVAVGRSRSGSGCLHLVRF